MNPKLKFTLGIVAVSLIAVLLCYFQIDLVAAGSMATLATAPLALPEAEFQQKVLTGVTALQEEVKTVETKQETLIKNYDQLDKDTKKAFEELTRLKNTANDHAGILTSMQKVQLQLQRESRMAFGDPMQRIAADEELRTRFNCAVRLAMDKDGDMRRVCTPLLKALGEDSSPGSTLIDDKLAAEIYDTLASFGVWNTFAVRRLSTKQTKYPVKTARSKAQFILTEANTIADDTTKAGTSVTLEVEVIAALLNVSRQLLDDAEFDVTADVLDDFAQSFNERLDVAALTANAAADGDEGGMTGVFRFGTAYTAAAGNTTVEAMDFEDITKALLTVDAEVLSRMAKWWIHPFMVVRMLSIKDSNGRPIFLTATEAPTRGGIGSILGYPVVLAHQAPSTNGADKFIAAFGDPNGYVVGIRKDFEFEASDHHKWNTYERSFRGIGRAGTKGRRANAFAILKTPAA